MDDYTVHVEARAPDDNESVITDEQFSALVDLLDSYGGAVGGDLDHPAWTATISLAGADAVDACQYGARVVRERAAKAGLPDWPLVRVEAVTEELFDRELSEPNIPDLVSGPEAAEILGVSRQRVHQLAIENPQFPRPLYELAAGKLWARAAVERFAEEWTRKPGRPKAS